MEQILPYLEAKSASIMEIGCGTGHVSGQFKAILPETNVIATDVEERCLQLTRGNYPDLKTIALNAIKPWPIKDESLDLVFSSNLYEHLVDDELYLKETKRVLKTGGLCLISTPHIFLDILWWCIIRPKYKGRLRCVIDRLRKRQSSFYQHVNLQTITSLKRRMRDVGLAPRRIKRKSLNSTEISKLNSILPFDVKTVEKILLLLPGWLQPSIVIIGQK